MSSNIFISPRVYGGDHPAPQGAHPLSDIAETYQRSSQANGKALQDMQADKQGRNLFGKVVDFLTQTPAEEMAQYAQAVHDRVEREAGSRIGAWVDNNTIRALDAFPEDRSKWQGLADQRMIVDNLQLGAKKATILGVDAVEALEDALDEITSAITGEMVDVVSSNKLVSVASSGMTSAAKDMTSEAMKKANQFFRTYNNTFVESPHLNFGGLDLVVDLTANLPIDLLSLSDIGNLTRMETRVMDALEAIKAPLKQASELKEGLEGASHNYAKQMDAIVEPLRTGLEATIPEDLKPLVNPARPLNYQVFSTLKSEMVVDWKAAREATKPILDAEVSADRDPKQSISTRNRPGDELSLG